MDQRDYLFIKHLEARFSREVGNSRWSTAFKELLERMEQLGLTVVCNGKDAVIVPNPGGTRRQS